MHSQEKAALLISVFIVLIVCVCVCVHYGFVRAEFRRVTVQTCTNVSPLGTAGKELGTN